MRELHPPAKAYSCASALKRLRLKVPDHPLFDKYVETFFELVSRGGDYRDAPEWQDLERQLRALEKSLRH